MNNFIHVNLISRDSLLRSIVLERLIVKQLVFPSLDLAVPVGASFWHK